MMETIIVDVNMMVEIVVILMLIRIGAMSVNALTQRQQVEIAQVHHHPAQLDHVTGHVKMKVGKGMVIVMMETTIVDVNMMVEIVVVALMISVMNVNARNEPLSFIF